MIWFHRLFYLCARRTLAMVGASAVLLSVGVSVQAKTYALVVGIDRYAHITPLQGAVNDAVDIASALSTLNPEELVILLDEKATRDAVLSTWRGFLEAAEAGDTIIVTFAGHGASEPAAYPESEDDGRDETFLLAGFQTVGPGAAERIRDDEVAALISARPEIEHILVADSCHSGTAIRSTQFDIGYRFFNHEGIADDPLPPPPPPDLNRTQDDADPGLNNSVFFAAVGDDELAPEINIDGKIRGALSYAFAQGLRGEADRDADGVVTKGELETHIRRQVKVLLDGRQKPRVSPVGLIKKPLFSLNSVLEDTEGVFSGPFADLEEVPVAIAGAQTVFTADMLSGALPAASATNSGIVVDFDAEEIRSANGDLLRSLSREVGYDWRRQTQAIVDKMRIVKAVSEKSVKSRIDVVFPFGDTLYFEDDTLSILITGRSTPHVTILNLSAEGRLQWLYPRYAPIDADSGFSDPPQIDPNSPITFDAYVTPPFGSEHIIVIETETPHDAIRRAAKRFDGTDKLQLFWREALIALSDVPHAVGIHSYHSREK
jgi:hypothetical protein